MKLDYFDLLSPEPISFSIGRIKQPTLRDISKLTFQKFSVYQVYLKLTPKDYYTLIDIEKGKIFWDSLDEEQKKDISLYDIIILEPSVSQIYLDILNYFFVERVVFIDNLFLIVDTDDYETEITELELNKDNLKGVINAESFMDVLDIIQQVCCIKSDNPLDEAKPKFKNKKAKRLYEKMLKAKEKETKRKSQRDALNLSLANIISATAAKTPGLNIINIWDTTLFQLYDQFGKIQNNDIHYMNVVRVAVWGDEKNRFDASLWYKNNYDKPI